MKMKFGYIILLSAFALAGCSWKAKGKRPGSDTNEAPPAADASPVETVAAKDLRLTFVSPNEEEGAADSEISIEVNFAESVTPTATWSLLYTDNGNSVENGKVIVSDLPITENKVNWQTAFVEPGIWYLFATLREGEIVSVHRASVTVTVGGDAIGDNRAPAVQFDVPNNDRILGDRVFITNGTAITHNIKWKATDPDGDTGLTYSVHYTTDDGQSWNDIALDLANDVSEVDWQIAAQPVRSARYRIKITAQDSNGSVSSIVSPEPFGVTQTAVTFNGALQNATDKCTGCHDATVTPTTYGYLDMTLYQNAGTADGVKDELNDIVTRTRSGASAPMPPNGNLSDAERDLFWLFDKTGELEN